MRLDVHDPAFIQRRCNLSVTPQFWQLVLTASSKLQPGHTHAQTLLVRVVLHSKMLLAAHPFPKLLISNLVCSQLPILYSGQWGQIQSLHVNSLPKGMHFLPVETDTSGYHPCIGTFNMCSAFLSNNEQPSCKWNAVAASSLQAKQQCARKYLCLLPYLHLVCTLSPFSLVNILHFVPLFPC